MIPIIILAGGKSSRFDYQDKGLIKIRGKEAISYVLEKARQISDRIIIISSNPEYDRFSRYRIEDIYLDCGPMAGIHSAMIHFPAEKYLCLSCDIPLIETELLNELIEQSADFSWTFPEINGQWHPLCSVIHIRILPQLEAHLREQKLKLIRFIESIAYQRIHCDDSFPWFHAHILDNMNDKLTLNEIEEIIK